MHRKKREMKRLFLFLFLLPVIEWMPWITLGCLRGLTSTIAMAKDKSWVKYLTEKSSWGRKPPIETRFSLYANVIDELEECGYGKGVLRNHVGVCKDTLEIWRVLNKEYGLDYRKIKCNCCW